MEAVEIVEAMMVIALRVELEVALAESILVLEYGIQYNVLAPQLNNSLFRMLFDINDVLHLYSRDECTIALAWLDDRNRRGTTNI